MNRKANNLVIEIKGSAGKEVYEFSLNGSFFKSFENEQIKDANLKAVVEVEKQGTLTKVVVKISGWLYAECDRCLENVKIPISTQESLTVKTAGRDREDGDDIDDSIVLIDKDDNQIDVSQHIYDFACLSLPMVILHKDGECSGDIVSALGKEQEEDEIINTPFSNLKDLLNQ